MPIDKDFKRLIRARMEKTGESYTAARAHLLSGDSQTPQPTGDVSRVPDDYEKLAGISDAAVTKATGRPWPEWAAYLDGVGAATMAHRDIAAHLDDGFDFGGWWAQTITVGYERLRGLRDYGQRRGGGYDVNKSKTVGAPVEALWEAFHDPAIRDRWLGDAAVHFHRATPPKSMRGKTPDGAKVDVYFTAKGDTKSSVSVQHQGLPDAESAADIKVWWGDKLDTLKALLTAAG